MEGEGISWVQRPGHNLYKGNGLSPLLSFPLPLCWDLHVMVAASLRNGDEDSTLRRGEATRQLGSLREFMLQSTAHPGPPLVCSERKEAASIVEAR